MTQYPIGSSLTFTNAKGETITGVVEGRNWSFDTLVSYIVRVDKVFYNVNANTMQSGHAF